MSFREKSAWITLVTVLLCFGAYFGAIVTGAVGGEGLGAMHLLLGCAAVLVVLQITLHRIASATTLKDGRCADEAQES